MQSYVAIPVPPHESFDTVKSNYSSTVKKNLFNQSNSQTMSNVATTPIAPS